MKNNATLAYSFLLIIGDFLAVLAAFSLAYILRVKFDTRPLIQQIPAFTYFFALAAVLPLWILVHAFIGLYNQDIYERRFAELGRLFVGSILGMLVVIGYEFVAQKGLFPARLVAVYGFALGFGFLVLFRTFAQMIRRSLYSVGVGISNVLVIGDTKATDEIVEAIWNTAKTGQLVLAVVGGKVDGFKSYESFEDAINRLRRPIHSIIQTELYRDQDKNNAILRYAQENHVSYRFVPGNTDLFVGNIAVELFGGLPMIAVHQTALTGWGRIAKRLFDLMFSVILLLLLSPFMLIIAILVKLLSPRGPVFLRQTRLTRHNREFKVFKFRTHKPSINGLSDQAAFAKLGKPELYARYKANGYVLQNDPRITPFGRFLRRTSLDELPQLFNVLSGDISLVGPRALIASELNTYDKKHAILSVKSGMTGLAQISGRRDISFDERRTLDVYYVQNWSFWNDIVILLKTLKAVFGGIGAK
ncbi:MAG TPA: sugar transferase [Candidatus Saccharimonadales bacterium]|nr:sugar transferase [Candidatus Saccharimonadales bacterium]